VLLLHVLQVWPLHKLEALATDLTRALHLRQRRADSNDGVALVSAVAKAIDAMPEYVRLYGFRYARATTGHPAVDPLRGVMLKMYRDNHYWMRDQVQEAAEQSGVECDKWMLHALLKQMCVVP
jgi:hypothetical protein